MVLFSFKAFENVKLFGKINSNFLLKCNFFLLIILNYSDSKTW